MKEARLKLGALPGLDPQSLTVDRPVPFSLKKLWYDLIDFETKTFKGQHRNQPAIEEKGDPSILKAPKSHSTWDGHDWSIFKSSSKRHSTPAKPAEITPLRSAV